jgi:hypothetical protein
VVAAAAAVALAIGGSTEPVEPPEANLAPCPRKAGAGTLPGAGPAGAQAGPVSFSRAALRHMRRGPDGALLAPAEVAVSGHRFVVLSVPLDLRNRVFLYFGDVLDNRGHPPTTPFAAPGYAETELQPCRDRPQTRWAGGIKVIGDGPVRLLVTPEGRQSSIPLRLGRPAPADRST